MTAAFLKNLWFFIEYVCFSSFEYAKPCLREETLLRIMTYISQEL